MAILLCGRVTTKTKVAATQQHGDGIFYATVNVTAGTRAPQRPAVTAPIFLNHNVRTSRPAAAYF
jgi:hypothetical protein